VGIACPAVGVVLNRVSRTRAAFERLEAELKDAAELVLLIGPARAVDRDSHAQKLDLIRTRASDAPRNLDKPLVVVATQTIEAGVDIDFDGLVTEAASLDALRQRFGRLNRAGRAIAPEAVILAHKDDIGAKADDAVYGDRIAKTWRKLEKLSDRVDGSIDFGIEVFRKLINLDEVEEFAAPTADAPVLLPAYADLWSQTSPKPNADPEVALFLHGPHRSPANVQIVWRADIDQQDLRRPDDLAELFSVMPPRAAETIEVPLWATRAWLNQTGTNEADFSDTVEYEREKSEDGRARGSAFRWAGKDDKRTGVVYASALRNGDLIVVPAAYGGCDEWGWNPKSAKSVIDVADLAAWPYRARRFAIRVTPELIVQGLEGEGIKADPYLAASLAITLAEHEDDKVKDILAAVRDTELPRQMRSHFDVLEAAKHLKTAFPYRRNPDESPRGVVIVAPRGLKSVRASDGGMEERIGRWREANDYLAAVPATESEELGADSDDAVLLIYHSRDVWGWAEGFAFRAGLKPEQSADVTLSASLHDAGKADTRYQAYYAGGSPYGPDADKVLAKSGQRHLRRGAWERAGLPRDWRHEALSVRLALINPKFAEANDPELVLWLIGTHHGFGRPLFPHADPKDAERRPNLLRVFDVAGNLEPGPGPQSLAFDFNGLDWAQIFEGLKRRYGIWGLARLEAFVRLADHRASDEGSPPKTDEPYEEAAE
jgi:CRISPR-associated endonuclease/helicase Cas3